MPRRAKACVSPCANPRRPTAVQLCIARVATGNVAPSPMPTRRRTDEQRHQAAGKTGEDRRRRPDQPAQEQRAPGAEAVADPAAENLEDQVGIAERRLEEAELRVRERELTLDRVGGGRNVYRSTYVIRYITQSRPRTTAVGFGRLIRGIREAIDYINEIPTTGRHRRVRFRAVPRRDDLRRRGTGWQVIGGLDQPAVDAIVHRALDAGINFIDTADVYLGRRVGDAAREGAAGPTSRGRARHQGPRANGQGAQPGRALAPAHPRRRRSEPETARTPTTSICIRFTASTRSRTSRTRCERSTISCAPARSATSAARIWPAWQLMKALAISRDQHLERFRCTQSYYSLVGRELERETIPLLEDQKLGLLVWSPLAGGFLSGKFTRDSSRRVGPARDVRFPARRQGKRLCHRRPARHDRQRARRERRRRSPSPGSSPSDVGHQRDHRREKAAAARRQPEVDRRDAHGGSARRRSTRRASWRRVSGVDGRAPFGSPSGRAAVLRRICRNCRSVRRVPKRSASSPGAAVDWPSSREEFLSSRLRNCQADGELA